MPSHSVLSVLTAANSPLVPIANYIERAVNLAAPEKRERLRELRESLNIRFIVDVDNGGVTFSAVLSDNGSRYIKMGLAAMERLWAYCYGFTIIFDIARQRPQGALIEWKNEPDAAIAWKLLRWAYRGEQKKRRLKWCRNFPNPGVRDIQGYVENADKFFTLVLGFIILHEVGHHDANHFDKYTTSGQRVRDELQADKFAFDMMLDAYPRGENEELVFIARANAVSTGLALLSGMELGINTSTERTHPKIPERLIKFFEAYVPEPAGPASAQQFPMYFSSILLSAFMQNVGIEFSEGNSFASLMDFFVQAFRYFP